MKRLTLAVAVGFVSLTSGSALADKCKFNICVSSSETSSGRVQVRLSSERQAFTHFNVRSESFLPSKYGNPEQMEVRGSQGTFQLQRNQLKVRFKVQGCYRGAGEFGLSSQCTRWWNLYHRSRGPLSG